MLKREAYKELYPHWLTFITITDTMDFGKQVATGEMELGDKYVAFMNEVSTGLDGASDHLRHHSTQCSIDKFHKTWNIAATVARGFAHAQSERRPRGVARSLREHRGFRVSSHCDIVDSASLPRGLLGTRWRCRVQISRRASDFVDLFTRSAVHDAMTKNLHGPVLLQDKDSPNNWLPVSS